MALAVWAGMVKGNDLVIAAAVLGLSGIPSLLPQVRAEFAQVKQAPFVEIARVCGVGGWRLNWNFRMRAALNPLIPLFGLSAGTLLSSSLAVEIICGWPGLGPLFVSSIESRDAHVVIGVVTLSTLMLAMSNMVSDMILGFADPRIRRRE
jgi:ABC-type dipeptide/oligopeptide/nickel transport system permease component